jgi:hypothetical protein
MKNFKTFIFIITFLILAACDNEIKSNAARLLPAQTKRDADTKKVGDLPVIEEVSQIEWKVQIREKDHQLKSFTMVGKSSEDNTVEHLRRKSLRQYAQITFGSKEIPVEKFSYNDDLFVAPPQFSWQSQIQLWHRLQKTEEDRSQWSSSLSIQLTLAAPKKMMATQVMVNVYSYHLSTGQYQLLGQGAVVDKRGMAVTIDGEKGRTTGKVSIKEISSSALEDYLKGESKLLVKIHQAKINQEEDYAKILHQRQHKYAKVVVISPKSIEIIKVIGGKTVKESLADKMEYDSNGTIIDWKNQYSNLDFVPSNTKELARAMSRGEWKIMGDATTLFDTIAAGKIVIVTYQRMADLLKHITFRRDFEKLILNQHSESSKEMVPHGIFHLVITGEKETFSSTTKSRSIEYGFLERQMCDVAGPDDRFFHDAKSIPCGWKMSWGHHCDIQERIQSSKVEDINFRDAFPSLLQFVWGGKNYNLQELKKSARYFWISPDGKELHVGLQSNAKRMEPMVLRSKIDDKRVTAAVGFQGWGNCPTGRKEFRLRSYKVNTSASFDQTVERYSIKLQEESFTVR